MVSFRSFVATILSGLIAVKVVAQGDSVINLTDANFEKATQAATGATTGSWFVKFYAPWCGHCKRLAPDWETLATELKQNVNVAHVDCTANKETCERFDIRGYPTLLLFSKGEYFRHSGDRSVEALKKFATEGYKAVEGTLVPRATNTLIEKAMKLARSVPAETITVYHKMKGGFVGAMLLGVAVGCICKGFQQRLRCCSKAAKGKKTE